MGTPAFSALGHVFVPRYDTDYRRPSTQSVSPVGFNAKRGNTIPTLSGALHPSGMSQFCLREACGYKGNSPVEAKQLRKMDRK